MKPALFALVLTAAACGAPVVCRTPHGLELVGPVPAVNAKDPGSDGFYCNSFERAESVIIEALRHPTGTGQPSLTASHSDPRLAQLADHLRGWQVQIVPEGGWADAAAGGDRVGGEADCATKQILISDLPFLQGDLAHELIHVAQDCHARAPINPLDPEHSNWDIDGPVDAELRVQAAQGAFYWSNPNCYVSGHYVGPADGSTCEAIP